MLVVDVFGVKLAKNIKYALYFCLFHLCQTSSLCHTSCTKGWTQCALFVLIIFWMFFCVWECKDWGSLLYILDHLLHFQCRNNSDALYSWGVAVCCNPDIWAAVRPRNFLSICYSPVLWNAGNVVKAMFCESWVTPMLLDVTFSCHTFLAWTVFLICMQRAVYLWLECC